MRNSQTENNHEVPTCFECRKRNFHETQVRVSYGDVCLVAAGMDESRSSNADSGITEWK